MTSSAVAEIESSQDDSLPTQRINFKRLHGALVPIKRPTPESAASPGEGTTVATTSKQHELYKALLRKFPSGPFIGRGHPYAEDKPGIAYFLKLDSEGRVVASGEARNIVESERVSLTELLMGSYSGIVAIEPHEEFLILYKQGS